MAHLFIPGRVSESLDIKHISLICPRNRAGYSVVI